MMRLLLVIILPLIIMSVLFSGGFDTLKKPRPTPVSTPMDTFVVDVDASDSAKDSLQLNTPKFKRNPKCEDQKLAIDLILDSSGSMQGGKIASLKSAVILFGSLLKPNDIVGVQSFSSADPPYTEPARNLYPFGTYNQASFDQAITGITAAGWTYMREGFTLARSKIKTAKLDNDGYTWVLIFLTDGIPETPLGSPTETQNPINEAGAMITGGEIDRLITIGLDLTNADLKYSNYATNMLKSLATTPADFHGVSSPGELGDVYKSIASSVCR